MSITIRFLAIAGLLFAYCTPAYSDEMCAAKVQNNDRFERAVDHLRISPSDKPRADDIVMVNRILLPGHENVAAIHWNCTSHARSYTIVGMNPEGSEIVAGEIMPLTSESQIESQPVAQLSTMMK